MTAARGPHAARRSTACVTSYAGGESLAEVVRIGFVESRHHGSVAVLDADGAVAASAGDVHGADLPALVQQADAGRRDAARRARLADPADLALVAASHSGEPMHVDRVRGDPRRGRPAPRRDLRCPPDFPLRRGRPATTWSGPAAAAERGLHELLRQARRDAAHLPANGWPLDDYLDPDASAAGGAAGRRSRSSPASRSPRSGSTAAARRCSRSRCAGLAGAFLRLVDAPAGHAGAAGRRRHAGPPGAGLRHRRRGRPQLMRGVPGLLSKVGAEGVVAVAVPGVGAVALKIDDGAAAGPAAGAGRGAAPARRAALGDRWPICRCWAAGRR